MVEYTVKQGETIISISRQHGFPNYEKVWDASENSQLKKERKNPNILFPSDQIHIPEIQTSTIDAVTEQHHKYSLKAPQLMLKLMLVDANSEPIVDTECKLTIENDSFDLMTDSEGKIEQVISGEAKKGTLSFLNTQHTLEIGSLDPVTEISGQQARFNNLGYFLGFIDGKDNKALRLAIESFQGDYSLSKDGDCGPNTQKKLIEIHGC